MTHYEQWGAKHNTMDAPFPLAMMPCIEKFFREVHPTLKPGQDVYPEVFATELFFPLQRQRELAAMVRIARGINRGTCDECSGGGGWFTAENGDRYLSDPGGLEHTWQKCQGCSGVGNLLGPVTVMEIGADKGGGLYHWCMCLPTVRSVIACEIRGTPYSKLFNAAFPKTSFLWLPGGSSDEFVLEDVRSFIGDWAPCIDVLFIDGDKLGMLADFDAYLPLMRRPGGVVFIHDVQDGEPYRQFKEIMGRGFKTEIILDKSEYFDLPMDFKPTTAWEGWLQHWRGRSCGVGVVYL